MSTYLRRRDMLADLREVLASGQILEELVKRDLKSRYKRSVLGLVWTMLNPLLMMAVTALVFSSIFRFAIVNFPVYFLSAYLVWGMFAQGTSLGSASVVSGATLSRKIYVPPALFPIASVNAAAINLLLSIPPLFAIVAITGGHLTPALLSLPLGIVLALVFTYGVALILSAASVFFHDTVHVYQVVLTLWMYLTPMFYPIDIVPPEWVFIVRLNPITALVELFRAPVYLGLWPDPVIVMEAAVWAVGAVAFGWWYFERSRDAFASYL